MKAKPRGYRYRNLVALGLAVFCLLTLIAPILACGSSESIPSSVWNECEDRASDACPGSRFPDGEVAGGGSPAARDCYNEEFEDCMDRLGYGVSE